MEVSGKSTQKIVKKGGNKGYTKSAASEIVFRVVAYIFIIAFALVCIYPLIYAFSAAISGGDAYNAGKVVLFPVDIQWNAFLSVIQMKAFWNGYSNTLFVTLFGTVWCMAISILGGYALSKRRLAGHKFFNFLLIFTMWFSAGIVPTTLNYWSTRDLFLSMGIADQKWVIVIAMGVAAFNIILLRNAFEAVPKEIEEAATVDGANDFQIMSKIYVPMSKATVATVALFYGISRWNGYYWAQQVVTDSLDWPLQVVIQRQISAAADEAAEFGITLIDGIYSPDAASFAMIIAAIIPIIIIYPFIQKYFAAGVNVGGVKE
ncbi:MAG: carbohydrate ABC transporter permease [Bacillales bacterium]|nr:carbohydrate ABC transporter permease [Bacillales bacterium]MDY5919904.1 carbohydrate ABC transporter permease [Candidatus Enteromonas sp.]